VHGDFKPGNVLVRPDGNSVVVDFGLAVIEREPGTGLDPAGTFGYLAPEVRRGAPATAGSDQYSFCVALFEALNLERPFDSPEAAAVDRLRPPYSDVPAHLHRLVARGLRAAPEARWPSLDELLIQLRRARIRSTRRWQAAGAAAATILGALTLGATLLRAPCSRSGDEILAAWTGERRARVHAALRSSHLPFATDTWKRLDGSLERYVEALAEGRVEACRATWRRGTQSTLLFDSRMRCYGERAGHLEAMIAGLSSVPQSLEHAMTAVSGLPELTPCADGAYLSRFGRAPATASAREHVEHAKRLDEQARATLELGQPGGAVQLYRQALRAAQASGFPPAIADAKEELGWALAHDDRLPEARKWLLQAVEGAFAAGDPMRIARASVRLADVVADTGDPGVAEAERWLWAARAAINGFEASPRLLAQLEATAGEIALINGELDMAASHFRSAADRAPDQPSKLRYRGEWRRVLEVSGATEAALVMARENLAMAREVFGPMHPETARLWVGLGIQLWQSGKLQAALSEQRRAYVLSRRSGARAAAAAAANNLGVIYGDMGRLAESRGHLELALTEYVAIYGEDSSHTADPLNNLAQLSKREGKLTEAEAMTRRLLRIDTSALGEESSYVAEDLSSLAEILRLQGRREEARMLQERAVRLIASAYGERSVEHGIALLDLALTMKAGPRQLELAQTGLALAEKGPSDMSREAGLARLLYGDVLRDNGRPSAAYYRAALAALQVSVGAGHELTEQASDRLARKRQ
jgi:tetratricopeptide (TPR) repeat protein